MLLRIEHETRFSYSEPVSESVIQVRMSPPSGEDQTVLHYRLRTVPNAPPSSFRDGFGNRVDLFNILSPHRDLTVVATSFVQTHRRAGADRLRKAAWPLPQPLDWDAWEYLRPCALVGEEPIVRAFVETLPAPEGRLADVVEGIVAAVRAQVKYEKTVTTAHTPVAEVLALGRGVCQDFSHLMIAACRGLGLPARYVSGYVHQTGELATHAWVQVWGGTEVGWVDIDPTHDIWVGDDHVVTAVGRDYADVPPNRGVWKGSATESIAVTVMVRPLERLPPEASEPNAPPRGGSLAGGARSRQRLTQQAQARVIRQQQSQQQQSSCGS